MKSLRFMYRMKIFFDSPVSNQHFTLKCIPKTSARQTISDLHISIDPKEFLSEDEDSFGNLCLYGCTRSVHKMFNVEVSGNALTGDITALKADELHKIGFYRYPTALTAAGSGLSAFHARFKFPENLSNLDRAKRYMNEIYGFMQYKQGVTDICTTAEEAFRAGAGVCQDYTHILLALCRIDRIPSRYVVGMLTGEGKSHAWAEIWNDGYWYALDPTNNCMAADDYIVISHGPDSSYCKINKGIFAGCTSQKQEVSVSVAEI